jgi:hypothetical protein
MISLLWELFIQKKGIFFNLTMVSSRCRIWWCVQQAVFTLKAYGLPGEVGQINLDISESVIVNHDNHRKGKV